MYRYIYIFVFIHNFRGKEAPRSDRQLEAEAARITPEDSWPKRDLRAMSFASCSLGSDPVLRLLTQREAQSK